MASNYMDEDFWENFPYGALGGDDDDDEPQYSLTTALWVWLGVAIVVGTLVLFGIYYAIKWLISISGVAWESIVAFFQTWGGVTLGVFAVLAIAWLLFQLRCKYLRWYGILEVCIALFVSTRAVLDVQTSPDTAHALAVLAAVYLCVRGFNNIRDALRPKVTRDEVAEIVIREIQQRFNEHREANPKTSQSK